MGGKGERRRLWQIGPRTETGKQDETGRLALMEDANNEAEYFFNQRQQNNAREQEEKR
jgi:hypothetical protein